MPDPRNHPDHDRMRPHDLQAIGISLTLAAELSRQLGLSIEQWHEIAAKAYRQAFRRDLARKDATHG